MGKARNRKRDPKHIQAPMHPDVRAGIEEQLKRFRRKFGRDPGPDDPIFFDPDASTPQPWNADKIEADATRAMSAAGIDPSIIYAYRKTGLLVSDQNWELLRKQDKKE